MNGPAPSDPDRNAATPADAPAPRLETAERLRYARHLVLRHVGAEGQRRLRDARVLVIGAGGLGSPVLLYLAAAGVGTLGLVEFDAVDLSNLQRQVLHGTGDVGRPKLDSARDRIAELNPGVEFVGHPERLTAANARGLIGGYDLVVDGSDNFPTRYLVNDACLLEGVPFVYGAVLQWEGQVSLFGAPGGPCYRCLFREPPPAAQVLNCAEAGVFGALPGIVGSTQALEALRWLIGIGRDPGEVAGAGEPAGDEEDARGPGAGGAGSGGSDTGTERPGRSLAGRLLILDALSMRWREMELRRDPECPVCGDDPTVTGLIDYEVFCGVDADGVPLGAEGEPKVEAIGATELRDALAAERAPTVVDVRERWEWEIANLAEFGAVHLPLSELETRIGELPDRPLVMVCSVGQRSRVGALKLLATGRTRVRHLRGGLRGWRAEVDPGFELP